MNDPYKQSYLLKRILEEGSFEENYPERALDWDYEDKRNSPYKPSDFLSGSNKLVYWKCHVCGYKSDKPTTIISHAKAMFPCEQCAIIGRTNQRYGEESIVVTNPDLLQEWDYKNNTEEGIFPENVTVHDTKTQVHWICKRGHHWRNSVSYRVNSTSGKCPKCQKTMRTSFPEQALFFYLSKQIKCVNGYKLANNSHIDIFIPSKMIGIEYDGPMHKTSDQKARDKRKNTQLKELGIKLYRIIQSDVFDVSGSNIYVIYDKDYVFLNYAIENICRLICIPYIPFNIEKDKNLIIGNYLTQEKNNSIAKLCPGLLDEWDYKKNGNISPECISYGSNITIFWKCKKGHSWSAPPSRRATGHGCPYCAGVKLLPGFNDLATLRPDLLDEWDYCENTKLKINPNEIAIGNNTQKVCWICKNNIKHKWSATVASRAYGTGCKYCAEEQRKLTKIKTYIKKNGAFSEKYPQLLNDWNYEKNGEIFPNEIPTHYSKKVWWKCHICGYEWQTSPDNRARGTGCAKCSKAKLSQIIRRAKLKTNGSLAQNHPDVIVFWDSDNNNGKTANDFTSNCKDKVNWKCPKCNHRWSKPIYKMTMYPCCPKCRYSLNDEERPVLQFDLKLNLIAKYKSPKEASIATGIARAYILSSARHDLKSTFGFVFRYENDDTDINIFKPTHQPTPKSVLQYTMDGKFVKEWNSISEAENNCPFARGNISSVCKGKRKSAGGFIWKYKESE